MNKENDAEEDCWGNKTVSEEKITDLPCMSVKDLAHLLVCTDTSFKCT